MTIVRNLPLLDEILASWQPAIGADFQGYRNHVYRMVNLCLSTGNYSAEDKEKIQIAGAFHDIGIWSDGTIDYLPPSERVAAEYLSKIGKSVWIAEVSMMIEKHHGIRSCESMGLPLVEAFRRADIADFSLGLVPMGFSREFIAALKSEFPNSGFHKRLAQLGATWFLRHPLNPLPMFRW